MQIRRITIQRFRGIEHLQFEPGARTVILGPNNARKSTVLEGLDLLLYHGIGRPRPTPTEVDYYERQPAAGFEVEAVLGDLPVSFRAEVVSHLEGWRADIRELVPEPDGDQVEPVARVRLRGTPQFDLEYEFSKPESDGFRFSPALRRHVGWVFDGRARDPARQLAFFQGGLLDRLFAVADLEPAVQALRHSLDQGATTVNQDKAVETILKDLSGDLCELGLLVPEERAEFEVGAVSTRELLQTLRLSLPAQGVRIPLARQGRGVQRLVLVAVLLRLAETDGQTPIGGFEEPEEALEPLRQAQLAQMLIDLTCRGGQVFVVTHSPEIARAFGIEDFLLLREPPAVPGFRHLARTLSPPVRQSYERWLDGAVVRGLFACIPVLVEGPSDRAVFLVFWREMERTGQLPPAARLGVDVVNSEGAANMPMLAAVLDAAGKSVVVWAEQDRPQVIKEVDRLRQEGHYGALLLHDPSPGRQNLEQALATAYSLAALATAMDAIATDRGYSWEEQREDLVSRYEGDPKRREQIKTAPSLLELLGALDDTEARTLVAVALGATRTGPFDNKGGRQARILAETLVKAEGVASNFAQALLAVHKWIGDGCPKRTELAMNGG